MSQIFNGILYSAKAIKTSPVFYEIKKLMNGQNSFQEVTETSLALSINSPAVLNFTETQDYNVNLPAITQELQGKTWELVKTGEDPPVNLKTEGVIFGEIIDAGIEYWGKTSNTDFVDTPFQWGEPINGANLNTIRGIKNTTNNPIYVRVKITGDIDNFSEIDLGTFNFITTDASNVLVETLVTYTIPVTVGPIFGRLLFDTGFLTFVIPALGYFTTSRSSPDVKGYSSGLNNQLFSIQELKPLEINTFGPETINGDGSLVLVEQYDKVKIVAGSSNYFII